MTPTDFPVLSERLNEMAEALGGKAVTAKGLAIWVQTLREFPLPAVVDVLTGWAKTSPRMPAPADVWKVLNTARAERLEVQAIAEKRRFQAEAANTFRRNPDFARKLHALALEMQKNVLAPHREWADVILARFVADRANASGEDVSMVQLSFACAVLHKPVAEAYAERDERRNLVA